MFDEDPSQSQAKIGEVLDLKNADKATEAYCKAYEKRYKTRPILSPARSDQTILKDLTRSMGLAKVIELLEHYLTMDNEWFITKAHSLDVFKKDLNSVNSDLGLRKSKQPGSGLKMQMRFHCDKCGKAFQLVVPLNYNFDRRTLCGECQKS